MLARVECKHYLTKGASMRGDVSEKAKGGFARAEALSPKERSEIATKAAIARWAEKKQRAITAGVLPIGGLKIPVFVLDDETRLMTQRGLQTTIGMGTGGGTAGAHRIA